VPGSLVGALSSTQEVPVALSPGSTPHRGLRLRVRLFHWKLDERLAAGVDPASELALAVRAAQLLSARHRRRLAAAMERLVREADAPPHRSFSVALEPARDQVAEARSSLLFLAYLLRHADPAGARGVAIVERLLTDGRSDLYDSGSVRGTVALRVQMALDALVGTENAQPEAWFSIPNAERGDLVARL
jgi:hypothetical protein